MKNVRFESFKDYFHYQQTRSAAIGLDRKSDTLAKLIKKLGYKSPSLLSMISKGSRLPSSALLEALLDKWQVPQSERELIRLQVEIERRVKKEKEVLPLIERLKKMRGQENYQVLDFNQFKLIANWYVYVVRELIGSPGFREDPILISKRLRGKVTPTEIKGAIEALQSVGLVKRDESGRLQLVEENIETTNGIPSEAIQEHHRSMMNRAIEALTEQVVKDRHMHSLTFRFDPIHSEEVQKKIIEFVKQINEEYESKASDRVYQLNLQFFEHTKVNEESELKSSPKLDQEGIGDVAGNTSPHLDREKGVQNGDS